MSLPDEDFAERSRSIFEQLRAAQQPQPPEDTTDEDRDDDDHAGHASWSDGGPDDGPADPDDGGASQPTQEHDDSGNAVTGEEIVDELDEAPDSDAETAGAVLEQGGTDAAEGDAPPYAVGPPPAESDHADEQGSPEGTSDRPDEPAPVAAEPDPVPEPADDLRDEHAPPAIALESEQGPADEQPIAPAVAWSSPPPPASAAPPSPVDTSDDVLPGETEAVAALQELEAPPEDQPAIPAVDEPEPELAALEAPIPDRPETPLPDPQRFVRPLPRVIAIANQKGGVGKTTTTVNLGASLAVLGYRTLVIDLDPQGNATTGLGINSRNLDCSIYDVILHDTPLDDCVEPTTLRNLFVAPATIDLAGAEIELVPAFSREQRLKRALEEVKADYEFVLIDCPPSLGLLTVNALSAATEVVVPIQCEYYALEGLGQLLRNVNLVQSNLNPALELSAIVLTMYDARTKLAEQVADEVREHFGDRVCRNVVPRTVRLSEAPSFGQPIIVFDPSSRGALAYRELAREVSGGPPQRTG